MYQSMAPFLFERQIIDSQIRNSTIDLTEKLVSFSQSTNTYKN